MEASEVQLRGKGTDLLEAALEQAARARHDLLEENDRLKGIIVSTANELQRTVYAAECFTNSERPDEVCSCKDIYLKVPSIHSPSYSPKF